MAASKKPATSSSFQDKVQTSLISVSTNDFDIQTPPLVNTNLLFFLNHLAGPESQILESFRPSSFWFMDGVLRTNYVTRSPVINIIN